MIVETSAIVAWDLGVRRGGRWLLRPASFGIAEGVTGLAGPPGVGKSSLLATFATLRRPHTGALWILGHAAEDPADLRAIRARIGYLPDHFGWPESLTVRDFVAYAGYYKRVPDSAVRVVLDRMELDDFVGAELGVLPPDVRLRAGLAVACVHEPELVLLDEPLCELDDSAAADLLPLIRTLAPTVVITAAAAQRLTWWCDRVFSLARGRLTELPTRGTRRAGGASRGLEPWAGRALDRVPAGSGAGD